MQVDDLWEIITNRKDNEFLLIYVKGDEFVNVSPDDEMELFHSREGISSHTLTVDEGKRKFYINIKDIAYIGIQEGSGEWWLKELKNYEDKYALYKFDLSRIKMIEIDASINFINDE